MTPLKLFTALYLERKEIVLQPLTMGKAAAIRQAIYRQRKSALTAGLISRDTFSLPLMCVASDTQPNAFRFYVKDVTPITFTVA
jgi:hypothetical protein